MPTGKISLNLIPREEAQRRNWEKFLNWVLTYGRYIIIGTEIIVLAAFLYRFKLDRDLKTLSEEIKRKQTLIESFRGLEEKTRALQIHLAVIKNLQSQTQSPGKILTSLAALTPQDVFFSQLKISPSNVTVSATAFSLGGFSAFLEGLKRSENFKDITLEKVRESQFGIEFTLKFEYRGS